MPLSGFVIFVIFASTIDPVFKIILLKIQQ